MNGSKQKVFFECLRYIAFHGHTFFKKSLIDLIEEGVNHTKKRIFGIQFPV